MKPEELKNNSSISVFITDKGLANFFYKEPDSKYFRLYETHRVSIAYLLFKNNFLKMEKTFLAQKLYKTKPQARFGPVL